jgi:predicted acetyltransferase
MDIELRTPTREDLDAIFDVRAQAFAVEESDRERWTSLVDPDRMVTAFLGTQVVGSLSIIEMGQWFGGRSVPMGGVATVVVRPEHRGQGIAARILERALERMRELGLAASTLNPATTRVYRSAGWEIGGDLARYRLPTRALERIPRGEPDRLRRITRESWPLVIGCYDAVAPSHPGWLDRSRFWWELFERDEAFVDQAFVYGTEGEDGLDGYVVFTQKQSAEWGYDLVVDEMVTRDATAAVTLWHFLGSHAMQARHITLARGPIESLLLVLPEQELRQVGNNRWMHRLVDAPAAIAARGFPPGVAAEVHLEIADRTAPWNDGRFVLHVEGGHGTLTAGGNGDMQVSINGLSTMSTGWASATACAEAGMLHHGRDADRAALGAMFAGPRPTILDEF